ncbi:class I adenylate-forming enzyme family protein [Chelativorans sp. Marseille-P2723]|uniref:class I adenylate-forming enzyme family protein n=1 Tax=Chelativorans sp. Marseille-P2723 TaxID=2709133 RepID=UPI00156E8B6A|nr:class I adenylate-forming enzyme family protein [Chelativorans sp. Marseille-P2723]
MSVPPVLFAHLHRKARLVDIRSGATIDKQELWRQIETRAKALAKAGVVGGCAAVAHRNPLACLRDIFALWTVGAMALVVNPAITAEERANVMTTTGAMALLDGEEIHRSTVRSVFTGPLHIEAPALTLMTSGTTGHPKGIVHTQRSLSSRIALNVAAIGSADLERSLCVLPLHFGHGLIGNVLTVLAAGGTLYLWPQPGIEEMQGFGPLVDREQITFMSSTPSFWKVAMRLSPRPEWKMRRVHVGSAPLSAEAWSSIAGWIGTRRVLNMYGMTETANWIAGASLEDREPTDGFVGKPWGGTWAVLDGEGNIRNKGFGEVLVASPSIMTCYLGMEDATAAAFIGPWFRTGDIGMIAEDGGLTLVGRIKHEINRGGIKIPAEEIDLLLERHPHVEEACAFPLADPVAGEAVAAAVVLRKGGEVEAIKAWCRERCRPEAVPTRIFPLDAIPRNDRGKIVRDHVREEALRQHKARQRA